MKSYLALFFSPLAFAPGYVPSQADVDKFVNSLEAYPVTDHNLTAWRANFIADPNNTEAVFCRNGDCTYGLQRIVDSFTMFGSLMRKNVVYNVSEWHATHGMLWLKTTIEALETQGGCTFEEDTPRVLYYTPEGKIWAVHQTIADEQALTNFLMAAMSNTSCSSGQAAPDVDMKDLPGYKPSQADVDKFVNSLEAYPVTDHNLTAWRANFIADPRNTEAVFCRNGDCTYGLQNIVDSFTGFGSLMRKNVVYNVSEWHATHGMLWLKTTMEALETQGGCTFEEDTPRILYYTPQGKIWAVHQTIADGQALSTFLADAMSMKNCTPSPSPSPTSSAAALTFSIIGAALSLFF